MGCRESFGSAGIIVKVAFIILFISAFCNWLAFTTTSWARSDNANMYRGLWRECTTTGCSQIDGTGKTRMGVVQAFSIVGFMSQNVAFLLVILFIFRDAYKGNHDVRLASAILLIISAIGWLIAVAIFGADNDVSLLHYSYALAVVALGLGLISGIFMLLGGRGQGHGSVGSK